MSLFPNKKTVRHYRKLRGFTTLALAAAANCNEITIKRMENPNWVKGHAAYKVKAVADALGVTTEELLKPTSDDVIVPVEGLYTPVTVFKCQIIDREGQQTTQYAVASPKIAALGTGNVDSSMFPDVTIGNVRYVLRNP